MLRGVVERTLNSEWLDAWFERTPVSIQAVYDKLRGIETVTTAELVHDKAHHWRRIQVQLKKPTRQGERTLFIWSNLPTSVASFVAILRQKEIYLSARYLFYKKYVAI